MGDIRKELLLYLESWPDSSLEALFLIYKGEAGDVDLKKFPDEKIKKFMTLVEKLRNNRRFEELHEIYYIIGSMCHDKS